MASHGLNYSNLFASRSDEANGEQRKKFCRKKLRNKSDSISRRSVPMSRVFLAAIVYASKLKHKSHDYTFCVY